MGIECGLIHSRFLKKDRITNETKWVELFGKQGKSQRNLFGRILVGTQVLEQSLDIDGDFMVTRICPTDMLLQRTGRLWRHRETDSLRPI
jgi:CRISPR-associated endonuclease/helicase Cas3